MFLTIGFLAWQILEIVDSQIETKRIFSLVGILIKLRKCRLQIENLEKLILVNKNWPNDPRIGCKCPFNLLKFLEKDINLEEKFEKFERGIWKLWSWSVKIQSINCWLF
jgi:hypothetical protein